MASIIKAADPEHAEELPIIADLVEDVHSQLPLLSATVIPSMPSTSKPTTQPPALADYMTSKFTGARRKSVLKRKSRQRQELSGKSIRHDNAVDIGNISPFDSTSLPDLILNLNDSEYFDSSDDEIKVLDQESDSSSISPSYVPSLSYRLQATSDVSTEPVTPLLSPDPSPVTSSSNHQLTPETNNYRVNPLSETHWSDSD